MIIGILMVLAAVGSQAPRPITFTKDVAPILQKNYQCVVGQER
jgi:hypothetical protein